MLPLRLARGSLSHMPLPQALGLLYPFLVLREFSILFPLTADTQPWAQAFPHLLFHDHCSAMYYHHHPHRISHALEEGRALFDSQCLMQEV